MATSRKSVRLWGARETFPSQRSFISCINRISTGFMANRIYGPVTDPGGLKISQSGSIISSWSAMQAGLSGHKSKDHCSQVRKRILKICSTIFPHGWQPIPRGADCQEGGDCPKSAGKDRHCDARALTMVSLDVITHQAPLDREKRGTDTSRSLSVTRLRQTPSFARPLPADLGGLSAVESCRGEG